jgi:hypothetical protein
MDIITTGDGKNLRDNPKARLMFLILLPVLLNTIRNPKNIFGTITAIIHDLEFTKLIFSYEMCLIDRHPQPMMQ